MKAARTYGVKDVRIEEVSIPEPGEKEVLIKVKYTGICGSDLGAYTGGWALPTLPHPITGKVLPVTTGHEPSGEVVKVGSCVKKWKAGDRVTVEPLIYCGTCEACKKGFHNLCENSVGEDGSGNIIGFAVDGAFAEYIVADEESIYRLPDNLDYQVGALTEPAAVALQAVQKSGIQAGQTAAIFGAGPIGLLVAIMAMHAGVEELIISDVAEERLKIAREIGVKHVFNSAETDIVKTIHQIHANGVDVAFDCAGVQVTLDASLDSVKHKGRIMDVAVYGKDPVVRMSDMLMKGVDIYTTLCYSNVYTEAIRIMSNDPETFRKVITRIIPLDKIVEQGFEFLPTDKSQAKILVSPETQG